LIHSLIRVTWILIGLIVAFLVAWGWFSSNWVIRASPCAITVLPGAFGVPFETISFLAEDKVPLAGWFVPAPSPSTKTIVIAHGWGANRSDVLSHTLFLNRRGGYNLFYFDFRGHGESGVALSSLTVFEPRDLRAALAWLRKNKTTESQHVALYGLSLGGAVSLSVAAGDPGVLGVVAESSFTSYTHLLTRFGRLFYNVPRFPLVDITRFTIRLRLGCDPEPFSPIYSVGRISPRSLLLIQGDRDLRMPVTEGETLYAHAGEPKTLWTIPGADHGECAERAGPAYEERLLDFYKNVFSL
jgi:pimeloyl-ACP methyl ester carboxylesterase